MNTYKHVSGVVSEDPAAALAVGDHLKFQLISFGTSDALDFPQTVNNWDFFNGAVLAFVLKSKTRQELIGTAIIVAPGLAITATHNFVDYIDEIMTGDVQIYGFGIAADKMNIWRVSEISWAPDDDIALLGITAASKIPSDRTYHQFGVTTRAPKNGEKVHLFGFRHQPLDENPGSATFAAALYNSVGTVAGVYPNGIPGRFMPFPLIELNCGSLGGMSGGAAIDERGLVVGVISRSLETENQRGPAYISWIIKPLTRSVKVPWPVGLYPERVTPLSLDNKLLYIDRREAIDDTTEGQLNYQVWFE